MPDSPRPFVARAGERARETFDEASRGDATWFTLISGDITPSRALSAGIAEFASGGVGLAPHRHSETEVYFVIAGAGVVTIDGVEHSVGAGDAVFIPGDAEHAVRCVAGETLRIFYVFPTDRFTDVVYRFSADEAEGVRDKAP